jgi:hypothetical protein
MMMEAVCMSVQTGRQPSSREHIHEIKEKSPQNSSEYSDINSNASYI